MNSLRKRSTETVNILSFDCSHAKDRTSSLAQAAIAVALVSLCFGAASPLAQEGMETAQAAPAGAPETAAGDAPAAAGPDSAEREATEPGGIDTNLQATAAPIPAQARAYGDIIASIELEEGAFSARLPEHLLGMGLALQRAGQHERAIKELRRGSHLLRITEGLNTPQQLALLEAEIESHIAMGDLQTADERWRYLARVQENSLRPPSLSDAFMQRARWERIAYEAQIDDEPLLRLQRMDYFFQRALTELLKIEENNSPALLPPLYGMLQSQYLLSGVVVESVPNSQTRNWGSQLNRDNQVRISSSQTYKRGISVISAITDVRRNSETADLRDLAEPALMLGDWQLFSGKRTEALETYAALDRELAAVDDAKELREEFFGQPQALPSLEGIRALPEEASQQHGVMLLEFGVTARGRVVDVERLDDNSYLDSKAVRFMRRLRQTLYRPRISNGMPVDTTGLVAKYDIADW